MPRPAALPDRPPSAPAHSAVGAAGAAGAAVPSGVAGAVAPAGWRAHARTAARSLLSGAALGTGIGAFLSLTFDDPFFTTWIFSLCVTVVCMALIHAGRHLMAALRRSHPGWPGWPLMLAWIVGVVAPLGYQGGIWLGNAITGLRAPGLGLAASNPRALVIVLGVTLLASLGVTAWAWSRSVLAKSEGQALQAQRQAAEAQLTLLQSQLEPHMLFNTLANLRVLIALDPPRAQAMLDRLIAYLRATLAASRQGEHALATEFQRLDDYLALMAVRMGARLAVRLDLPEALRALPVPALLLQPLVENAIQHGLEPQVEGGRIEVVARRDGAQLVLTVRDTGVGLPAPAAPGAAAGAAGGFGTAGVRERLAVLHGTQARLDLRPADDGAGGTVATVTLPLPAAPPAS